MTKRFKFANSALGVLLGSAMLFGLVFLSACDNDSDPEPELYELPGIYTFKKAILQTTITIGPYPIPAGTDITAQMAGGLLSEADCVNPANGAVDLKSDFKLFFTCLTESKESQAGTWSINSDTTELTLNLAISTGNLPLKIEDLEIDETTNVIGGSILNFPLTKELIAGFLAGYPLTDEQKEAIMANVPPVTPVDVDIEFQKMP